MKKLGNTGYCNPCRKRNEISKLTKLENGMCAKCNSANKKTAKKSTERQRFEEQNNGWCSRNYHSNGKRKYGFLIGGLCLECIEPENEWQANQVAKSQEIEKELSRGKEERSELLKERFRLLKEKSKMIKNINSR